MDQEKDQNICFSRLPPAEKVAGDTISGGKNDRMNIRETNRERRYPLVSFHELPDYMKDNEYILNYYRAEWPLRIAFLSLFQWHNETLNVWTHLLGFLLFLVLAAANLLHLPQVADFITMFTVKFPSSVETNVSSKFSLEPTKLMHVNQESSSLNITTNTITTTTIPDWPLYVLLAGSMFCLLSSTTCHLLCCHSRHLNTHLLHLDYAGISIMIIASFFPPIYYIFQCTPHWQILYLSTITVIGLCILIAIFSPAAGKSRSFRTSLFVAMGLFGLVPAVHALVANWDDPHRNVTLAYESAMALSYLIGAVFYVGRVPERWRPGRFDLAGHSHQIFHVCVVAGALAHYGAAQILMRFRSMEGCD